MLYSETPWKRSTPNRQIIINRRGRNGISTAHPICVHIKRRAKSLRPYRERALFQNSNYIVHPFDLPTFVTHFPTTPTPTDSAAFEYVYYYYLTVYFCFRLKRIRPTIDKRSKNLTKTKTKKTKVVFAYKSYVFRLTTARVHDKQNEYVLCRQRNI